MRSIPLDLLSKCSYLLPQALFFTLNTLYELIFLNYLLPQALFFTLNTLYKLIFLNYLLPQPLFFTLNTQSFSTTCCLNPSFLLCRLCINRSFSTACCLKPSFSAYSCDTCIQKIVYIYICHRIICRL